MRKDELTKAAMMQAPLVETTVFDKIKHHAMGGYSLGYLSDTQYEMADLNDTARLHELFAQWVPNNAESEDLSLNTFWDEDVDYARDALECYITAGGLEELTIFEQKRRYFELVLHVADDPEKERVDLSINEYTEEFDGVYDRTVVFTALRDILNDVGFFLPFTQKDLNAFNTRLAGLPFPNRIEEYDLAAGIAVATERNWHGRPTRVLFYLRGRSDGELDAVNLRREFFSKSTAAELANERLGVSSKFWREAPALNA